MKALFSLSMAPRKFVSNLKLDVPGNFLLYESDLYESDLWFRYFEIMRVNRRLLEFELDLIISDTFSRLSYFSIEQHRRLTLKERDYKQMSLSKNFNKELVGNRWTPMKLLFRILLFVAFF